MAVSAWATLGTRAFQYPPDPELSDRERTEYLFLLGNDRVGEAFMLQQSFLLRKRLNGLTEQLKALTDTTQSLLQSSTSLLRSSKRIEKYTYVLLGATIVLLIVSILFRL